jgi:hypothetical protein
MLAPKTGCCLPPTDKPVSRGGEVSGDPPYRWAYTPYPLPSCPELCQATTASPSGSADAAAHRWLASVKVLTRNSGTGVPSGAYRRA